MIHPWKDLPAGRTPPEVVTAVIEIPQGARNKYELDKDSGMFRLDRVLYSAVHYPGDYGLIPRTLHEDNDPLDVFAPAATAGENGIVTFTVQRDPNVTGASIRFEVSQDFETWTDSTASTVLDSTTPLPSGLVIDTYQITFTTDNALRIRIVLSP